MIRRPRLRRSPEIIAGALQAIRDAGFWVRPVKPVKACSDRDDDIFLECAQAADAEYLVTGNLKHFPPSWIGTRIVSPRWLLDHLSHAAAPIAVPTGQYPAMIRGIGGKFGVSSNA